MIGKRKIDGNGEEMRKKRRRGIDE